MENGIDCDSFGRRVGYRPGFGLERQGLEETKRWQAAEGRLLDRPPGGGGTP